MIACDINQECEAIGIDPASVDLEAHKEDKQYENARALGRKG